MRSLFLATILPLFFHAQSVGAQHKTPFSRMDVFELEWVSDPQISPDGKHIVFRRNYMDIMQDKRQGRLWLINADGSNLMKLTSADISESSPRWSPDGQRIAFISTTEHGAEIFVYWIATGKVSRLTQLERSPGALSWSPDGTQIAFSMLVPQQPPRLVKPPKKPKGAQWADPPIVTMRLKNEADGKGFLEHGYHHIFTIPAEGGTPRQRTSGPFHHRSKPVWTKDGQALLISANREDNSGLDYRNSEIYAIQCADGKITPLTDRKGPDTEVRLSPDGSKIAYLGYDDRMQTYHVTRLYIMDPDGSNKEEIQTGLDRSISDIRWDRKSEGLFIRYDDMGNTKIGHVTLSGQLTLLANNLGGTSIGRPYGGGSFSVSAEGDIAYTYTTPDHPAELAYLARGSERPDLLTALNADLLPHRSLGRVEEVWYKASTDNRDIQGWLVYPPGYRDDRPWPLIVENHGGPISNYGDRFSPEMQLYAAAGYVVFYPNPRGSTGYGEAFGNLLYHHYPGDDYQDIMDGVNLLVQKGIAAEDSLFVTGGSAGGIMTAWIIGQTGRFRAAAVVKPVMNWISKTLTADNYFMYADYRYPGQPWENPGVYMQFSPISLVGHIVTPTLVMVGSDDRRTPPSEAKQLYHALKIRDIPTAYVEIPGASHFIARRPSQMIAKIDHVLAWFEIFKRK